VNVQQYDHAAAPAAAASSARHRRELPCQTLHHVGMPEDRDDMNQVPLCEAHHQGPLGVHGLHRRAFERYYKLNDLKLLAITRRLYLKEFNA
jgi:hypothetical protein